MNFAIADVSCYDVIQSAFCSTLNLQTIFKVFCIWILDYSDKIIGFFWNYRKELAKHFNQFQTLDN